MNKEEILQDFRKTFAHAIVYKPEGEYLYISPVAIENWLVAKFGEHISEFVFPKPHKTQGKDVVYVPEKLYETAKKYLNSEQ